MSWDTQFFQKVVIDIADGYYQDGKRTNVPDGTWRNGIRIGPPVIPKFVISDLPMEIDRIGLRVDETNIEVS